MWKEGQTRTIATALAILVKPGNVLVLKWKTEEIKTVLPDDRKL